MPVCGVEGPSPREGDAIEIGYPPISSRPPQYAGQFAVYPAALAMAERQGKRVRLTRNPGFGWACDNCGTEFHAREKGKRHVATCATDEIAQQPPVAARLDDDHDEDGSTGDEEADGEWLGSVRGLLY